MLRVEAPNGPASCSGAYELVSRMADGRAASGKPLWKHVNAERWIYSMSSGRWGIGGVSEKDKDFRSDVAYLFCDEIHGSAMPNGASCNSGGKKWQRWNGAEWAGDAAVKITSDSPPAEGPAPQPAPDSSPQSTPSNFIFVEAPNGPSLCAGLYRLYEGKQGNGRPFWKHVTENRWIYWMRMGRWGIGGEDAHDNELDSDVAYVFCAEPAESKMPTNLLDCVWERWTGSWVADPAIKLRAMASAPVPEGTPSSKLSGFVQAGAKSLPVASLTGFEVGGKVVIDQGKPVEEVNEIVGFGSLLLKYATKHPHAAGATVIMLAGPKANVPSPKPNDPTPAFPVEKAIVSSRAIRQQPWHIALALSFCIVQHCFRL